MFLITKQLMICTSITFYTPASSSSLASLVYSSNNNFWNIILKEMACGCIRSRCKCYFWYEDDDVTLRNTVLLLLFSYCLGELYIHLHVPTYIGANKECLWSGQTADCICIFHFGVQMLKMTAVHRAFHMCIHVHILFCYRCNNATTITMNSDVPSVPITTLAGIHSLTDRKCSS